MTGPNVEDTGSDNVFTTLLIAIGVVATVVAAMMLAMSDGQQVRSPAPIVPTLASQLAAVSFPPTAQLPTAIPTVTPTSTPQPSPTNGVEVDTDSGVASPVAVSVLAEAPCGNVPDSWVLYAIQADDTLLGLSASTGATAHEISQANCLDLGLPLAGNQIYLPPLPPERPSCGPPLWWVRYTVRPGDTLSSLARRYGTSVFAIMQANCLVSSRIYAGRALFLPPVAVAPTASPTATATPSLTPTPSATIAPTSTPSPAATSTPTVTPGSTPTGTPAVTPSATATASGTPAATPTATIPSPTATATPTQSPSPTGTPAATSTPTPVPSNTPTPVPSNTPTPTLEATEAPTSTPVGMPTATPTVGPAQDPTPTATVTPGAASPGGSRPLEWQVQ